MIPSEEFEDIILQKRHSDTEYMVQQKKQNVLYNLPNPQDQHKQSDLQQNLFDNDSNDQDFQLKYCDLPGLKKQQSDTSYDLKKNQLKSFAKNRCKKLSSMLNQQQNPKQLLEGSKDQKDEEISIIKFDETDDQLNDIRLQIQQLEAKLQEKKQKLYLDHPFKEIIEIEIDQQEPQIETKVKQQNEENTCPICGDDSEVKIKLLQCDHRFCFECYKKYLNDKIKNGKVNNIPCLQEGCVEIFPESIIQKTVSPKKYEKYLKFKLRIEVQNDPNKKWCPAPGCEFYVEKNPHQTVVQCECGALVCFNCGQLAHLIQQCELAIEIDFLDVINKYSIKRCPGCHARVEKNAGCNHMTCRCGFQYCWVCLQPYYEYHYRYWSIKGCAIWSNGRFKTRKVINNPDLMRRIFFLPRLILFLLRGPLIFLKLLFIAFRKSVTKPFCKLNKKLYRQRKPRSRCLRGLYFIFIHLCIVIFTIIIFPFYFLFYRIFIELKWLKIKGCGY